MPVVRRVPEIAFQPVRPMSRDRVGIAAWKRAGRRRLAFLCVVAAVEPAVHYGTAGAVVLDRGDAAPLQLPLESGRQFVGGVLPVMFVECPLEQRWYLLHDSFQSCKPNCRS